jgi:hypothetical protein
VKVKGFDKRDVCACTPANTAQKKIKVIIFFICCKQKHLKYRISILVEDLPYEAFRNGNKTPKFYVNCCAGIKF